MARKPAIPDEIKQEVQTLVDAYNKKNKKYYKVVFKSKYCLLSRMEAPLSEMFGMLGGFFKRQETQIGRLEWTGDMNKWSFAVYKYSKNGYDSDEWMFPSAEKLDGTIVGAMNAGLEIYP